MIDRGCGEGASNFGVGEAVATLASRRLKVLRSTSASQIDSFEKCQRIWANNYLFGARAESTPAQKRGTTIDDNYVQPYLKNGSFVDGEWKDLVKALVPFLPSPGSHLLIQHRIELPTFDGGPTCVGFLDFAEEKESGHVEVGDLKTTSDFRYCKTEAQLADNTQMITYARWAYEVMGASTVAVSHVYARTRGAKKGHKVGPVHVSKDHVAERWSERVETVKNMIAVAQTVTTAEELPPDTSHCDDYGGCPFKSKCGFVAVDKPGGVFSMITNGKSGTLAERLQLAKKRKGFTLVEEPVAAAPAGDIPDTEEVDRARAKILAGTLKLDGDQVQDRERANTGWIMRRPTLAEKEAFLSTSPPDAVLPPDAPSRTTTPEEIEVVEAKKRGRPKKVKTTPLKLRIDGVLYLCEIDAEGNELSRTLAEPVAAPVAAPVVKTKGDNGAKLAEILKEKRTEPRKAPPIPPILFIDCMASKNNGKLFQIDANGQSVSVGAPVSMADWLGPIAELAALAHEVTDYRLISYTSKGVLATAIQSCIDTCPAALLIDSSAPGADEVIAALTPHAAFVVRRFQ